MPVAKKKANPRSKPAAEISGVRGFTLGRIALCGGATRAQIVKDLGPLASQKFSPGEWRDYVGLQIGELLQNGLCTEARGKLSATPAGVAATEVFFGTKSSKAPQSWSELRDGRCVAKALGLARVGPTVLNSLAQPDGLRAQILQQTYKLKLTGPQTPTSLRAALAIKALERAFGNKIKSDLGSGTGFSAKAGRLLAGQLAQKPRDFGTDVRLVQGLACEAVDARQTDADTLRLAILRRFVSNDLSAQNTNAKSNSKASAIENPRPAQTRAIKGNSGDNNVVNKAANDTGLPGAGPQAIRRPSPEEFSQFVKDAAATCAEGWAGNRKAPISKVWNVIAQRHRGWALSEIEFKCMLAEAHRAGLLMLASADLKSKDSVAELEASAISYKNTIWHLVRVTDESGDP